MFCTFSSVYLYFHVVGVVFRLQDLLPINSAPVRNISFIAKLWIFLDTDSAAQNPGQPSQTHLFHVSHLVDYQSIVLCKRYFKHVNEEGHPKKAIANRSLTLKRWFPLITARLGNRWVRVLILLVW